MVYGRIYVVTNNFNGKQYVGQTTMTLKARWKAHPKGDCRALVSAIKKYGLTNFSVRELEEATTQDELNRKEQAWIVQLGTLAPHGYNLREGGSRGKPTEETRLRQAEAHRGKQLPEDVREKMRASQKARRLLEAVENRGPTFTDEARQKMRQAKLGTRHSPETLAKMIRARTGKKASPEARAKMSAARTAHYRKVRESNGNPS